MHLPGRQIDPKQVQRDIWRLGRWERERRARRRGRRPRRAAGGAPARRRPSAGGLQAQLTRAHRGPAPGAARAYLKGIGFDDEALSKPIVGVANTWTETMPCNFNHRALAAKVKEGKRGRRHADGVQHDRDLRRHHDGHAGMKTSLVSREVIADSIELVARGHLFDAVVALSGCDKTIPGTVMALARLDVPEPDALQRLDPARALQRQGRHDPGGLRGDRRARGGQDHRRGADRAGGRREPGLRRLRRPVHRQHDGDGVRDARHLADGRRRDPRAGPDQGGRGLRRRNHGHGRARPRPAAERHHHARVARERDRRRGDERRLDQRRPAPAGRRPRGRDRALDRRLRPDLLADPDAVRPQARRPLRRDRPARGGRHRVVADRLLEAGLLHEDAATVTGKTIGEPAREALETPGQQVVRPLDDPIKPTGGIAILRGNLAPEGCVVKLSGHERTHHEGPRACSTARRRRWRPSPSARSTRATSSSSATRAPPAAPACARCWP